MGLSRQEHWSGLPFPSPGDLPKPGIEPRSPALAGRLFTTEPPEKPYKTGGVKPFPSPGDLPNLGIKQRPPTLQAGFLPAEPQGKHKQVSHIQT